jgi:hypothetical protein
MDKPKKQPRKCSSSITWQHSYGNKIERLAQEMPGHNISTNTIVFIKKNQVPQNRAKDMTYGLITCLINPEKIEEPNQTRLVAGGDSVHYPSNAGTPTADLLTVKLLINSTISTPNAKYDNGHKGFLPQHPHGPIQMHATTNC